MFIVPALVCMCCSRSLDIHMPDYPLVVTLGFNHNHPLDTASVLRHRDVAPYVSAKFAELLSTGYSPLAALAVHKYDLCLEHGPRQYLNFVNDRHHFPDAAWCYRYVLVHVCHADDIFYAFAANPVGCQRHCVFLNCHLFPHFV